jgi:hypothetical protein
MVLTKQYKAAISLLMVSRNKVLYYLKAKKKGLAELWRPENGDIYLR